MNSEIDALLNIPSPIEDCQRLAVAFQKKRQCATGLPMA